MSHARLFRDVRLHIWSSNHNAVPNRTSRTPMSEASLELPPTTSVFRIGWLGWVIDRLPAGQTPPDDRRQVSDQVPRESANAGELRHDLPVDLPPPPTPPSVVAVPTPRAHDTVTHSGVDGYVQTVSGSGCLSMNARHTSTTAPYSNTRESDSILGAKTVGDGIHTAVEPVSRFIITRKTDALTAE